MLVFNNLHSVKKQKTALKASLEPATECAVTGLGPKTSGEFSETWPGGGIETLLHGLCGCDADTCDKACNADTCDEVLNSQYSCCNDVQVWDGVNTCEKRLSTSCCSNKSKNSGFSSWSFREKAKAPNPRANAKTCLTFRLLTKFFYPSTSSSTTTSKQHFLPLTPIRPLSFEAKMSQLALHASPSVGYKILQTA